MDQNFHDNVAYIDDSGQYITGDVQSKKLAGTKLDLSVNLSEKQIKDDSYDPYQHRTVEHPLSNNETIIHLLKCSLGTGILAMPQAIYHAGYILGTIGTVVIGLIAVYAMQILLKSHYEICKRRKVPSMSYPEIAASSFLEGPKFLHRYSNLIAIVVNVIIWIYQVGACGIYVVFIATNIKSVVDYFTDTEISIRIFMVILLLPLVFINWVRNLKYLAPFSFIANIMTWSSLATIFYFIFREPITFEGRRPVGPISEFPYFIGTVLFSLESIGTVMPLENSMQNPRKYVGATGVLSKAFMIITVLFIAMGSFGYLRYGNDIRETITLNLETTTNVDMILAQLVKGSLAFGIFISYGIAMYVAIDLTWNKFLMEKISNNRYKLLWEYVIRTGIALIAFLLAIAIPKFDLFISLFGAFCLSILGVAFPAIIEILLYYKEKTGIDLAIMIVRNSLITVFGLISLIIGTFTSMQAIVNSFSE